MSTNTFTPPTRERVITGCSAVHPDRRGGQHVAKPCTGVLVIDDDLGIGVLVKDERSQHQNLDKAREYLALVRARVLNTKEHVP